MKLFIKQAKRSDATEFYRLEAECFEMKRDGDAIYFWVPMLDHQFCFKAVIDDKIVGGIIAMSTKKANTLYINSLFVDPKYRGHKIASKLLKKIFSMSPTNNIVLEMNPEFKHLYALYTKHDFKKTHFSKNHFTDGEDRILMLRKPSVS